MKGRVFNIQPYSLHDGPGIRTVVFLKGCPLKCLWCSNPESQLSQPQVYFDESKCINEQNCHRCESVCRYDAILNGKMNFKLCSNCGKCADICPSKALSVYGKDMTVEEVIETVSRDEIFYHHGNGGITLSGGEPLMQADFAIAILKQAKQNHIDTAIETCGYYSSEVLEKAAKYLDYIMFDIKLMNDLKHIKYTGKSNKIILNNLKLLFEKFENIPKLIRTPVIPGINDNEEEILAIKSFLKSYKNYQYELLPYHRFGENKYRMLGRTYADIPKKLDENLFSVLKNI